MACREGTLGALRRDRDRDRSNCCSKHADRQHGSDPALGANVPWAAARIRGHHDRRADRSEVTPGVGLFLHLAAVAWEAPRYPAPKRELPRRGAVEVAQLVARESASCAEEHRSAGLHPAA
jgi:hypothetical protein